MTNKAMDQTFQTFYYSHMMWAGQFNNETWLNDTLFGFDPIQANPNNTAEINATNAAIEMQRAAIYNDTRYGMMGSEANLTIWIAATMGNPESITHLKNHWFSGVYQISDSWFNNLTNNSTSQIMSDINYSNNQLKLLGYFTDVADITNTNLWAQQWAKGDLLNNTALCKMPNECTNVTSVKNIGMDYITMPEITQSGCDVNFTR